jgi:hypothetical protein
MVKMLDNKPSFNVSLEVQCVALDIQPRNFLFLNFLEHIYIKNTNVCSYHDIEPSEDTIQQPLFVSYHDVAGTTYEIPQSIKLHNPKFAKLYIDDTLLTSVGGKFINEQHRYIQFFAESPIIHWYLTGKQTVTIELHQSRGKDVWHIYPRQTIQPTSPKKQNACVTLHDGRTIELALCQTNGSAVLNFNDS